MLNLIESIVVEGYPSTPLTALKDYLDFIDGCTVPLKGEYGEVHHILPKSMFPGYRLPSKHPWNVKRLKASDHFVAHYLLFRLFPLDSKALHAWRMMWVDKYKNFSPEFLETFAAEYQELKQRHSKYMRERVASAETRAKMSKAAKAKVVTPETRVAMKQGHMGHPVSEETRKKIGDSQRGVPRGPVSASTLEKRAKTLSQKTTEEKEATRRKLAAASTGRRHTEETRAKMKKSSTGHQHSAETRAKISASRLARKGHSEEASSTNSGFSLGPLTS